MKYLLANKVLIIRKFLVIHPILFAVFPILFLYTHNISQTSANQIFMPMLFSALGALLLLLILTPLMKNVLKAGLATTLFVIFFFSYGRFCELLERWDVFVPSHGYLLPGLLLVWGYCVYFIKIARRDFRNTTKILNVVAVVLILLNLFSIVSYQIGKSRLSPSEALQQEDSVAAGTASGETSTKPDIYYIILDEYAHPDTMAEYYNYDNSEFVTYLVDKGFFVASQSKTKTMWTYRSIASSLNIEYIPDAEPDGIVLGKLENSQVAGFLRAQGYQFIYFGSWYDQAMGYRVAADLSYNFYESAGGSAVAAEFPRTLWKTTMLAPFYDYLTASQFDTYFRGGVMGTIESLKEIPEIQGPKFIFAHIVCPHAPFVFGQDGEFVSPSNWDDWKDGQFYLGQYVFISGQIKDVVNSLLKKSPVPPIIIIQSDHGIRANYLGIEAGENKWQKIFNAYYLPGNGEELLYDDVSPVNSFRLIFNHYFGTNYDLLED